MFLAGGDEQLAGVAGGDGKELGRARGGGRDQGGQVPVEVGDLLVELLDATTEREQRELGGEGVRASVCGAGVTGFIVSRGFGLRSGS